jgi:DNA invertase Pin-like site-specific DNA recombinase
MRVIIYTRVSTTDQAENGSSLDAQRAKLDAYASLYDLQIVAVISDDGESAATLKRPGLQRALDMLRSGEADGLLVAKLDRLSRSVADWQRLIESYFGERGGKQLFSVADSIDTRTAAGRLVLNVLVAVAQWEREAIGERTREVLRHRIRSGKRCGKVRFGFDLADDGETLLPNAHEQETIALMRDLDASGRTLRQIAAELSARGIRTKEQGAIWTHTAVRRILDRAA